MKKLLAVFIVVLFIGCTTSHVTHKRIGGVKVKCIKVSTFKCR